MQGLNERLLVGPESQVSRAGPVHLGLISETQVRKLLLPVPKGPGSHLGVPHPVNTIEPRPAFICLYPLSPCLQACRR